MKVLFVASFKDPSASGRQRLWAMQECNLNVITVDKDDFKRNRFSSKAAKLLHIPDLLTKYKSLQNKIKSLCDIEKPDVIWLEWAKEYKLEWLQKLKKSLPHTVFISFQDDNPWGDRQEDFWMWKNYVRTIPGFDVHLVKRKSDIENIIRLGGKSCCLWKHGVYKPIFFPAIGNTSIKYPVSFIGTCMDNRQDLIKKLLENNIPVHVFGNKWKERSDLPYKYPHHFHGPVVAKEYADVIRHSQICLGLVSHSNKDEWTMRTYEVPGCSVMLLAERTPAHEQMFLDGLEAAYFSTSEECVTKVKNLLTDYKKCEGIGKAAYKKCFTNNWTIENRMKEVVDQLKLDYGI